MLLQYLQKLYPKEYSVIVVFMSSGIVVDDVVTTDKNFSIFESTLSQYVIKVFEFFRSGIER